MPLLFLFLFLLQGLLGVDFDYVFIGTSPIPLFEALYKHSCGNKVLILEADSVCGGAWKSIDICGMKNVDMGCHDLCSTKELNEFLEEYGGCRIRSIGNSTRYFSKGSFELIDHLLKRIAQAEIPLLTNCKLYKVSLDVKAKIATLHTAEGLFTTSKIVVTPGSSFSIANQLDAAPIEKHHKFYHIYLLIQDPTAPRFCYHSNIGKGISRAMNLTAAAGMERSGRQLIAVQTHTEKMLSQPQDVFNALQQKRLVDPDAYLLQNDIYIYTQPPSFQLNHLPPAEQTFFELIQTSLLNRMSDHIPKWKNILKPYKELGIKE